MKHQSTLYDSWSITLGESVTQYVVWYNWVNATVTVNWKVVRCEGVGLAIWRLFVFPPTLYQQGFWLYSRLRSILNESLSINLCIMTWCLNSIKLSLILPCGYFFKYQFGEKVVWFLDVNVYVWLTIQWAIIFYIKEYNIIILLAVMVVFIVFCDKWTNRI